MSRLLMQPGPIDTNLDFLSQENGLPGPNVVKRILCPDTRCKPVLIQTPESPPTFRRVFALFLKLLPLVVSNARAAPSSLRDENLCIIRARSKTPD